jgi:hypothetical protein
MHILPCGPLYQGYMAFSKREGTENGLGKKAKALEFGALVV